jgi:hypothetical protein
MHENDDEFMVVLREWLASDAWIDRACRAVPKTPYAVPHPPEGFRPRPAGKPNP